ncbi:MFS transporter [Streptomyces sp. NPDC056600]|uniref:MFS transporter n=1 Tax=Streptomyces sp. NPDC056600 TaxID=3345874 RepID=UPI0036B569EF
MVAFVDAGGRGAFFALTSLYLTTVVGIPVTAVGLALTFAGGVGLLSSLAFGHLADRWSARKMLLALHLLQGCALEAYIVVRDLPSLAAVASLVMLAQQGNSSVRSAAVGRAFLGDERVRIRATMRTVTNLGMAVGTSVAAIPLAVGTGHAYRITMAVAGALFLASALMLTRLPAHRVDARRFAVTDTRDTARPATPGRPPHRNMPFLAVTALSGVFGIQFGLFEVAMPMWVVGHTQAPDVLVSLLLLVNTGVVIALQIPMSRTTADVRGASRTMARAGRLMAGACVLWAAAGWAPPTAAVAVLLAAALVHSLAEIASSAAGWVLSFELADPERTGAYQGVYQTGYALGAMAAPAVVTLTVIDLGTPGWALLALVFLASASGIAMIARRAAEAREPNTATHQCKRSAASPDTSPPRRSGPAFATAETSNQ